MTTTLYRQKIIFIISLLCCWQNNSMTPTESDADKPLTQQELRAINAMPHFTVDKNDTVYQTNFYVDFEQLGQQDPNSPDEKNTPLNMIARGSFLMARALQNSDKLPSLLAIYSQQKQDQEWEAQETATHWRCLDF